MASSEQFSKRAIEDQCLSNGTMIITSGSHAYYEAMLFLDPGESELEGILHFGSTLQFISDFIVALFGLYSYCEFSFDLEELIKMVMDLF